MLFSANKIALKLNADNSPSEHGIRVFHQKRHNFMLSTSKKPTTSQIDVTYKVLNCCVTDRRSLTDLDC